MLASWTAIVLINLLWCLHLWHRRRRDHSLLLPFFLVYAATDTYGYIIGPAKYGGLDLIPIYAAYRPAWTAIASAVWLSWYAAPLLVSVRLSRHRIGWRVWAFALVPLVTIAVSELLGASAYQRRALMHYVYEPATLVVALALLSRYAWRQVRKGEAVDFLAFAAGWTGIMLALKTVLLFDGAFRYQAVPARAFYFVFMAITVIVYHLTPRIRAWLLLNS